MTFALSTAELAGIVVHSTLYGVYLLLGFGSAYVLTSNAKYSAGRRRTNRILFVVAVVFFFLITAHWIVQIDRLFDAFIRSTNTSGGANAYYAQTSNFKFITKTGLYVAQTFIGDSTMIYRLYVVWGENWRVLVLPITSMLIYIVASAINFSQVMPGANVYTDDVGGWKIAMFVSSLFINVFVTALISWRIWKVSNELKKLGVISNRSIRPVIQMLVESAFVYTFCLVSSQILYLAKSSFQIIALDATSPAIGIAFGLVIVRTGIGHNSSEKCSGPIPIPSKSQSQQISEVQFANNNGSSESDIGVVTVRQSDFL